VKKTVELSLYKRKTAAVAAAFRIALVYANQLVAFFERSNLRLGHENKQACFRDSRLAITS